MNKAKKIGEIIIERFIENICSNLRKTHFLFVVHALNRKLGLRAEVIVADVVGQVELFPQLRVVSGHDLVEYVVATLSGSLTHHARLLEQIWEIGVLAHRSGFDTKRIFCCCSKS